MHLLLSLARAGDPGLQALVDRAGQAPSMVGTCQQLDQLPSATDPGSNGVYELSAPMHFVVAGERLHLKGTLREGVTDEELGPMPPEFEVEREGQDLWASVPLPPNTPVGPGYADLLQELGPSGPGCRFAVSVETQRGGGLVTLSLQEDEHLRAELIGLPIPPEVDEAWQSGKPRRRALGVSEGVPIVAFRANFDLEPLLRMGAQSSPNGEAALDMLQQLEDARVDLDLGAELALLEGGVVAVLPLRRPIRARWVLRRMAADARSQGQPMLETEGLLVSPEGVVFGATRRALVIGSSIEHVGAVIEGEGQPWQDPDSGMAERPGLVVSVELSQLAEVRPELARLPLDGQASLHADLTERGVALEVFFPGLFPQLQAGVGEALKAQAELPSEEPDPVGSPPSTEALSVLMLLRQAEERAYQERGQYLPYSGGPRELDQLDGEAVLWEGIPELGVEPMETACRYEISLGGGGFTARSLCDEDADGKVSITVVGPGSLPARITPPDVR